MNKTPSLTQISREAQLDHEAFGQTVQESRQSILDGFEEIKVQVDNHLKSFDKHTQTFFTTYDDTPGSIVDTALYNKKIIQLENLKEKLTEALDTLTNKKVRLGDRINQAVRIFELYNPNYMTQNPGVAPHRGIRDAQQLLKDKVIPQNQAELKDRRAKREQLSQSLFPIALHITHSIVFSYTDPADRGYRLITALVDHILPETYHNVSRQVRKSLKRVAEPVTDELTDLLTSYPLRKIFQSVFDSYRADLEANRDKVIRTRKKLFLAERKTVLSESFQTLGEKKSTEQYNVSTQTQAILGLHFIYSERLHGRPPLVEDKIELYSDILKKASEDELQAALKDIFNRGFCTLKELKQTLKFHSEIWNACVKYEKGSS